MAKTTDIRSTPQDIVDYYARKFGVRFDLDVCADSRNHKAPRWFGPGAGVRVEDAFKVTRWFDHGNHLWMNPPYSEIPRWLDKAVESIRESHEDRGDTHTITCLLPANTSARWFHRYLWSNTRDNWKPIVNHACFHPKRLTFAPHATNAMWPSLIVHLK